ncbi:hypothetical protein BGX26_002882 [Mortierella sp. AD094]|nr:hypothetical protein BGX26_002882 [Mortierella sp. AD094]
MTRKLFQARVVISVLILAVTWLQATNAVKFDLPGQNADDAQPVCISHYVDEETQVIVKVKVGPGVHQKISLEVTDDSMHLNQLWRKDNLVDEQKGAFLNKEAGDVIACFTNVLDNGNVQKSSYLVLLLSYLF